MESLRAKFRARSEGGKVKVKTKSETARRARRYRESTHLIPTPGIEAERPDDYTTWPLVPWKVLSLAATMIVVGIAVEIVVALSNNHQGFAVPKRNIFSFLHVQVSFLTSFFPTFFILPLSLLWTIVDYVIRWYQPYIVLSQGHARAEDSLMLDYVMANRLYTVLRAFKHKQHIVYLSMLSALATTIFQPLAGALLAVKQVPMAYPLQVTGTTQLGLVPDFTTLNAFLAAAGFAEAAAFQGLPDPPFVRGTWASAQFVSPLVGTQSSVAVHTTGINTLTNCATPAANPVVDTSNATSFTFTVSLPDGCTSNVTFDPRSAEQQYGTSPTDPVSCGLPASTPQQYAPVMFWFYHNATAGQPGQAGAVVCRPSLDLFQIVTTVSLSNASLTGIEVKDTYTAPNNVSGAPLDGNVFNAVLFGDIPGTDQFVKARATTIGSQIPGAILRFMSQDPTRLQNAFDSPDGFLNVTNTIYSQHLAVSAKTVYFVPANQKLSAEMTTLTERLIVDNVAGHALASALIIVGLTGLAIHIAHRQVRARLHLTAHPGTIASVVALTAHSGFGELLYPFDTKRDIRRKLRDMRFSLDPRTGAIVADVLDGEGREHRLEERPRGGPGGVGPGAGGPGGVGGEGGAEAEEGRGGGGYGYGYSDGHGYGYSSKSFDEDEEDGEEEDEDGKVELRRMGSTAHLLSDEGDTKTAVETSRGSSPDALTYEDASAFAPELLYQEPRYPMRPPVEFEPLRSPPPSRP
ncbi:hypothetical protein BDW22DRAFT_1372815 [Trametopsis cervina]|nr:hypothetical protein BDW22DRAFT_1372815 [Trametopsis cervina]